TMRLDELEKKAIDLGITIDMQGKKIGKTEYIRAIRECYLSRYHPNGEIPFGLDFMLTMDQPSLCSQLKDKSLEIQDSIFNDDNYWLATKKLDGVRAIITISENDLDMFSRNNSVSDCLPISYGKKLIVNRDGLHPTIINAVLDCEIVATAHSVKGLEHADTHLSTATALLALETEESVRIQKEYLDENGEPLLKFICIGALHLNDSDLRDMAFGNSNAYAEELVRRMQSTNFPIEMVESTKVNKKEFHNKYIEEGGEGTVIKDIRIPYNVDGSRAKSGWVKVKRTVNSNLDDTLDAFITGFEEAD
ncbi:unnamed protein product, partial [marine sediment metagenome]